ncbi:MAG: hypothetical protein RL757_1363 [Bacteroidota bacterium]|jgi:rare lipoprotein A
MKFIPRILFVLFSFFLFFSPVFGQKTTTKKVVKTAKVVKVAQKTVKKKKRFRRVSAPKTAATEDNFKSFEQTGMACIYSLSLHGTKTANGERFDKNKLTAAHLRLPIGSHVRVTSLTNGKSVELRINDRGPFSKKYALDMSPAAAKQIGLDFRRGKMKVKIERIR